MAVIDDLGFSNAVSLGMWQVVVLAKVRGLNMSGVVAEGCLSHS
jgi:hypothetical protein